VRIRVWNAFASNNSGSYTIVGRFDDAARAAEVARELEEVIAAHTTWHAEHNWEDSDESPLVMFARARGLDAHAKLGAGDAWPQHGAPPSVIAIDHQVIVHAPYTVTLPRTFGELFYVRGGVVDTTLDHAHHPLVVQIEVYWPYSWDEAVRAARLAAMEAALMASETLWSHVAGSEPWRKEPVPAQMVCAHGRDWLEAPLVVGAVFADLVEGVRVVAEIATAHEAQYRVGILEALDRKDPLSHLRAAPAP